MSTYRGRHRALTLTTAERAELRITGVIAWARTRPLRATLTVILAAMLGMGIGATSVDWYPALGTYGVTVSNPFNGYDYCSADVVHGHLEATCETAS